MNKQLIIDALQVLLVQKETELEGVAAKSLELKMEIVDIKAEIQNAQNHLKIHGKPQGYSKDLKWWEKGAYILRMNNRLMTAPEIYHELVKIDYTIGDSASSRPSLSSALREKSASETVMFQHFEDDGLTYYGLVEWRDHNGKLHPDFLPEKQKSTR